MEVTKDDIKLTSGGFVIEKITKATDEQLNTLEECLSNEIASVEFCNVEEYDYLYGLWFGEKTLMTEDEKWIMAKILNSIFHE